MRLHIKNDGIPAARPGRCFACLMTTKTKPKNVERNRKKTAQKTTNCCAGAGLAKSLYLLLFPSTFFSFCFSVSFAACLRRLGLIFDSSIINHTLTFHTTVVVAVAASLENPGNLLTTYLTVQDCLVQTILTVCLVSEHFLSNNVLSSFRLGFQMGQSI